MDAKLLFLEKKMVELTKCPDSEVNQVRHPLSYFKSEFKQKWAAASYKHERFVTKNEQWLSNSVKLGNGLSTNRAVQQGNSANRAIDLREGNQKI